LSLRIAPTEETFAELEQSVKVSARNQVQRYNRQGDEKCGGEQTKHKAFAITPGRRYSSAGNFACQREVLTEGLY
jgi:hypothetical protein